MVFGIMSSQQQHEMVIYPSLGGKIVVEKQLKSNALLIYILRLFLVLFSLFTDESVNASSLVNNKRGRKPGRNSIKNGEHKGDMKAKLERSRQSARECRARKKLRYQYLEELVTHRERSVLVLRRELDQYRQWCTDMDEGKMPEGIERLVEEVRRERDLQMQMNQLNAASHTPRPPTRSDETEMVESPS